MALRWRCSTSIKGVDPWRLTDSARNVKRSPSLGVLLAQQSLQRVRWPFFSAVILLNQLNVGGYVRSRRLDLLRTARSKRKYGQIKSSVPAGIPDKSVV